jgi:hypothetical protein
MPNAAPETRSAQRWKAAALLAALGWVVLSVVSRSWYAVAAPFGLLSARIAAGNLHCVALRLRGKKAPSMIPLVGGFLGLTVVQIGLASGQWSAWPALMLVLMDPVFLFLPMLLWDRFVKRR